MNLPPCRYLVVEDGDEDAFILTHLLERAGAAGVALFRTAEGAMEALETLARRPPGEAVAPLAVFLDVGMPGTSGLDVLQWIRREALFRSTVIVLFSASDEPRNLGKAAQLGADAYLIKFPPMSVMRDLLAAIQRSSAGPAPRPVLPIACNLLLGAARV